MTNSYTGAAQQTGFASLSANSIIVLLAGQPVGFIQSLTSQDDYAPEPLSGVGDIHAHEWVPTFARYTIQVDRMCLRRSSLMTLAEGMSEDAASGNTSSSPNSTAGSGVTAGGLWEDGYRVMQGWTFDIEIVAGNIGFPQNGSDFTGPFGDVGSQGSTGITYTSSGKPMKKFYNCSFATGTLRVQKNTIVVEDATFYCTRVSGDHTLPGTNPGQQQ